MIVSTILYVDCKQGDRLSKFKKDLTNNAIYDVKPLQTLHGIKWKYKTHGYVFSSPVVFENKLFEGSNDSCFYAIDARNGQLIWKYKTGGIISSTPAVSDGGVYFESFDGNLYALDIHTGRQKWYFYGGPEKQFTTYGIHGIQPKNQLMADPWDMYLSSPTVVNNKVLFGSGNGKFYAVDVHTGKEVWSFATNDVIHSSPAVSGNKVFFGGWDTYLHALDIETGREIWRFETGKDTIVHNQTGIQASPVVYNGIVYFGCRDAHLYAIDEETGKLRWKKFNNYSWVICTPVIKDSILYYGTSDTHKLWALKASTGDSVFNTNLRAFIFSSPIIAQNAIYVGDFSGSMYAVDTHTGKIYWTFRTQASIDNKLAVLNKTGNIPDEFFNRYFENGKSYTYDNNIQMMKDLYSIGSILTTPTIENGTVYVGSADGTIYALE